MSDNAEQLRLQKDLSRVLSEHGDKVVLPYNGAGYGVDLRENHVGGYDAFVKHSVLGELKIGSYDQTIKEGAVDLRQDR